MTARAAEPTYSVLTATSELNIDSRTVGLIHHAGTVHVGAQGAFYGTIRARVIAVEGEITGELHADEAIRLTATARVRGDLYAPRVALVRGAQLRGRISTNRVPDKKTSLDELAVNRVLTGAG